ncbi:MAG: UDP-phosphate alpha-4-amino-4-deoxy-L-arabinose arabinosyl transferase, partial [Gillisia sp.]
DPGAFSEIASRESSRWFNYNVRPFWYYWSFFTQSGIWTIPALVSLFYWYLKPKIKNPVAYRFYFLWTIMVVILLSIIPEKKSRYLLPALIPLAVTTGFYVVFVIRNFKSRFSKLEKFPLYLNFVILSFVAFAAPVILYIFFEKLLWQMKITFLLFGFVLFLLGIFFLYGLFRKKIKLLFALQVFMILLIINFGFPLVELISPNRNSPNMSDIKTRLKNEKINVFEASSTLPELVWKYGSPIPIATSAEEIPDSEKEKFGILVGEAYNPDWKNNFKNYNFKFIDTLNLNPTIAKKPNVRLLREFYILTQK